MTEKTQPAPSLLFYILLFSNIATALAIGLIKTLPDDNTPFPIKGTLIVLVLFGDAVIIKKIIVSFLNVGEKAEKESEKHDGRKH